MKFNEYGFTLYCGLFHQMFAMVHYLNKMHKKYPDIPIVTNFYYSNATHSFTNFQDVVKIKNDSNGVIVAIYNVDYEFSKISDYNILLLSELSQFRNSHVKVVATANFFDKVPKDIRELFYTVIFCEPFLHFFILLRKYSYFGSTLRSIKLLQRFKFKWGN